MTSKPFMVADLNELLALHRVFREAKFCTEPDDTEISDSPIVERLFRQLMEAIVAAEVEREGESARQKWKQWLAIDESRDEWSAGVMRATRETAWSAFSEKERREYVSLLMCPFVLDEDVMKRFIAAVGEVQIGPQPYV